MCYNTICAIIHFKLYIKLTRRNLCIKNNFNNEREYLKNWKMKFNPYILNEYFLQIIYINQAKTFLNKICYLTKKDKIYQLNFANLKLANIAFNEISELNLNWKKTLNGLVINIDLLGHTEESKLELEKIISHFFNVQKISLQSKRNSILKKSNNKKHELDKELKEIVSMMSFKFNVLQNIK